MRFQFHLIFSDQLGVTAFCEFLELELKVTVEVAAASMAMAGKKLVLVALLAMVAMCAAKEYQVEWKLPAAENTYSAFQQKPFNVGDTLSKCCYFHLPPSIPFAGHNVIFSVSLFLTVFHVMWEPFISSENMSSVPLT